MKKLRIGIIGACRRGGLADNCHNPEAGVEVVAGMDISQRQIDSFKDRYKDKFDAEVTGYLDYNKMLEKENLDGVFVTSPDFCHEEHAVAALEKGIPIYLEKPMAITIDGCDRIMRTAQEHKTKVVLGHNMRYMTVTNQMRDLILADEIGQVKAIWCRHFISYGGDAYFRDWHAEREKATGLLLQKGAHDIDIIHWLAGAYTERVIGMGMLSVYDKLPRRSPDDANPIDVTFNTQNWPPEELSGFNPIIDVEDQSMIMMQLTNGVQASYMQCHFTPDDCRNYTIIGTRGRIENYSDHGDDCKVSLWKRRRGGFRLEGDAMFRADPPPGTHGGADPKIVQSFIDAIRGEGKPVSTAQAARYSVATGCKGTESIRNGNIPLDIPKLPKELEDYDYS
jgi:predicted dehydrogenase